MNTYSLNMEIIVSILLTISILFRSYLLLKYKWVGKDSFYHLLVAQEIKKNKKLPKTINNFIVPEEYDYPPLLHVFLSLFNKKSHQKLQYIGGISDILTGLIILVFCDSIFGTRVAILACMFYLFTPMTIDSSFSLGPRSTANFFMTASLLSFAYYYETGLNTAVYVATISSLFVLLAHRLTTQSLVFSLITLSFTIQSIIPVYILAASIIMAVVITKGFYLTVIKGHIDFIKIFATKILHKNERKEMASIFPNPLYLLFNIPIFVLFLMSLSLPESSIIKFFSIVGLSLTILSFVWIFGEGIRHMNNAIFAFAILGASYASKMSDISIIIIFMFLLLFSTYKLFRMEKMLELGNITTTDMLAGFEYIKSHKKKGDVLLCLPLDFTYNAAYFTDCIMLQGSGGFAKGLNFNQMLHKQIKSGKINETIEKYNARWIIIIGANEFDIIGKMVFSTVNVKVRLR